MQHLPESRISADWRHRPKGYTGGEVATGVFGHCAVGLAAKPLSPKVPLGVLFLAALTLDILAITFGIAGFESGAKGIPWSHGLLMSVLWSGVFALAGARIFHSARAGAVIGLVVLSHWLLDFVSHPIPFSSFSWRSWQWSFGHPLRPDLPLLFAGSPKVGLGLYNTISAVEATALELGMLLLGFVMYMRAVRENKAQATG